MKLLIYFLIMIFSLNIYLWWWTWLMVELLNWFLMLMMKSNYILLFLMWQSFSSVMIMFSVFYMNNMILLFILLKMGMPPFHHLIINSQFNWSFISFIVFNTIHKYLPCLILMNFMYMNLMFLMLIFLGILFFLFNFSLKLFILGMSIVDMFWMISSWLISMKIFTIYLLMNLFILLMWLNSWKTSNINFYSFNIQIILIFLCSIPPLSSFVMKWLIVGFLNFNMGLVSLMGSWFIMILMWMWLSLQLINKELIFESKDINMMMIMLMMLWLL
uniref:NADH dehydrogenase subunit 2 n=1 Tax=Agamermis sp. BH-2006 TaxID=390897 RepID=Q0Z884_9BILA|nr:NADH dehydrogenase subunit 2 [Agamermis sp. BH-2006]ABG38295.1 NADH dehydrogenase subunit 2 [Agamermis sp. BH-2006]